MKIVQTLWLPTGENETVAYKSGWLSAEYHWIGWALSCFLLRKYYTDVELYTTECGREVLINQLKLPYTKVHILPEDVQITPFTWALAKLITYNLQEEPFIHIDGDVFIWQPFEKTLLNSSLIVQNAETDLTIYKNNLHLLLRTFDSSTDELNFGESSDIVDISYNLGIVGGSDIEFFKEYSRKAIDFVCINQHVNSAVIDSTSYCMLFEQFSFALAAMQKEKRITTFFEEPVNDLSYLGFDNFRVMLKRGYLHLMGQFKLNRYTLKMLISEFRENHPYTYYEILRLCKAASIGLDYKVYQLPELDPLKHSTEYFIDIFDSYKSDYIFSESTAVNWIHYYAKDIFVYKQIMGLITIEICLLSDQLFCLNNDFILIEETEPVLKQQIKFPDTCTLEIVAIDLDELTMIIVDSFLEGNKNIKQLAEIIKPYFDLDDFTKNEKLLQDAILDKINSLLYWGVLRWLN